MERVNPSVLPARERERKREVVGGAVRSYWDELMHKRNHESQIYFKCA